MSNGNGNIYKYLLGITLGLAITFGGVIFASMDKRIDENKKDLARVEEQKADSKDIAELKAEVKELTNTFKTEFYQLKLAVTVHDAQTKKYLKNRE